MKKCLIIAVCLFLLSACSSKPEKTIIIPDEEEVSEENSVSLLAEEVDLDMTYMSGVVVFGQISEICENYEEYAGKSVKMKGTFNVAELGDNIYYACLIKDATACCAQGIEFQWEGDHAYPEDYPEMGDEITVVGTFSTYKENTQTYCQLENSELTF